jgi:hypothetical protein
MPPSVGAPRPRVIRASRCSERAPIATGDRGTGDGFRDPSIPSAPEVRGERGDRSKSSIGSSPGGF